MKTRRINSVRQAVLGISPRFRDRGLHAWLLYEQFVCGQATIRQCDNRMDRGKQHGNHGEFPHGRARFSSRSGGSMRNRSLRKSVCAETGEVRVQLACFMSLLLTGATGFLGRNILLRALSEGTEVLTAVRNADKLLQQLRFEKKDPQEIQLLSALPDHWPRISPRCAILGGGVLFERNRSDYFLHQCRLDAGNSSRVTSGMPHGGHLVAVGWWSDTERQGGSVGGRSRCPDYLVRGIQTRDGARDPSRVSKSADFDPASADDPWAARHGDASAFSNGSGRSPYQARTSGKIL